MSRMSDLFLGKYESAVRKLAKATGYAEDFLWDIWMEIWGDQGEEGWNFFRDVTLERDW